MKIVKNIGHQYAVIANVCFPIFKYIERHYWENGQNNEIYFTSILKPDVV